MQWRGARAGASVTAFRGAIATDAGRVRTSNQDLGLASEDLLAVADGMGGHVGGEIAARVAIDTLRTEFSDQPNAAGLIAATTEANRAVFERSERESQLHGMGTTITAAALVRVGRRQRLVLTNVGDSRAYLLRDGTLSQLTEDHSLVEEMVRNGELTTAEAAVHPHRHILTRALGIDRAVSVDSWELDPTPGSRLLLCSDGLTNEVTDHDISAVLTTAPDPSAAAAQLVALALEHGGSDNVTVVVADLDSTLPDPAGADGRSRPARGNDSLGAATAGASHGNDRSRTAARPRRHPADRVLSLRVVLFVLALVGVLGGSAGVVGWYVKASYFVGLDHGHVAVFRGRPGGFLWFTPEVVDESTLTTSQVFPPNVAALRGGMLEPSLAVAEAIVTALGNEHHALALPSVDTSSALGLAGTTTTVVPTTTTTTTAAPVGHAHRASSTAGAARGSSAPTPVNAIAPAPTTSTSTTASPATTTTTVPAATTAPTSTTPTSTTLPATTTTTVPSTPSST